MGGSDLHPACMHACVLAGMCAGMCARVHAAGTAALDACTDRGRYRRSVNLKTAIHLLAARLPGTFRRTAGGGRQTHPAAFTALMNLHTCIPCELSAA